MYAFSPGGGNPDALKLLEFEQDLANFLLVRGPYAVLGHGWLGCSNIYTFPDALNLDFGEPTDFCHETAPNSGVFDSPFIFVKDNICGRVRLVTY